MDVCIHLNMHLKWILIWIYHHHCINAFLSLRCGFEFLKVLNMHSILPSERSGTLDISKKANVKCKVFQAKHIRLSFMYHLSIHHSQLSGTNRKLINFFSSVAHSLLGLFIARASAWCCMICVFTHCTHKMCDSMTCRKKTLENVIKRPWTTAKTTSSHTQMRRSNYDFMVSAPGRTLMRQKACDRKENDPKWWISATQKPKGGKNFK